MSDSAEQDTPSHAPSAPSSASRKRKRDTEKVEASRSGGTYSRKKASKACLVCRNRKTRCDNVRPVCGFCQATGGECRYPNDISSRFDQASLAIIEQLNHLEGLIKPISTSHSRCSCSESQHSSPSTRNQKHFDRGKAQHRANDIDAPPGSVTLLKTSADMGIEAILQWPVFKDRLGHLAENTLVEDLSETLPPSSYGVANGMRSRGGNSFITSPRHQEMDLSFDTVNWIIGNFLLNNFPSNPILDPMVLRRDAHQIVKDGLGWDGKSCLLLLVLAIGSISTSIADRPSPQSIHISRDDPSFAAAELYFQESQRRIGPLSCENSLLSTQCTFFTAVYLSYTMRISAAWKYFVMAGTQCLGYLASRGIMDVGAKTNQSRMAASNSNRSRSDYDGSWQTSETPSRVLEESLYWVILKGEAELCLHLGLPGSGLNEIPYPHTFPSPPDLEKLSPHSDIFGPETSSDSDRQCLLTGWLYYLGEIALRRVQNRVYVHYYGGEDEIIGDSSAPESHSDLSSFVSHFDEQLEQWMQSLPQPLKFSSASTQHLEDQLRWVLCGHRVDVIELLRFPAIRNVLAQETGAIDEAPTPLLSQDVSQNLELAAEFLQNAVHRIDISAEGFLHRHQGNWLTIRGCTRSALVLLGAKLMCQGQPSWRWDGNVRGSEQTQSAKSKLFETLLPARWETAVLQVLDMLRVWEGESKDIGKLREIVETLLTCCR